MIHLVFLAIGLSLAIIGQLVILLSLKKADSWGLKRSLQLLGLAMPCSVIALFSYSMLPDLASSIGSLALQDSHSMQPAFDEVLVVIGLGLVVLPIGLALLLNLLKVIWLYWRVTNSTWLAPVRLTKLLTTTKLSASINTEKITLKLWPASKPFAFNLPGLLPGQAAQIVISTRLVEQLTESELRAVLAHEIAHLARRDFQIMWLASWLKDAFIYLPTSHWFMRLLQTDKEFASDELVAQSGGLISTLALAEALLKVWEELLASNTKFYPTVPDYFEAPGLILLKPSANTTSLAEQRVNRLLELGEHRKLYQQPPTTRLYKLCLAALFGGSIGLWFLTLELTHLLMMPLGCAIAVSLRVSS